MTGWKSSLVNPFVNWFGMICRRFLYSSIIIDKQLSSNIKAYSVDGRPRGSFMEMKETLTGVEE